MQIVENAPACRLASWIRGMQRDRVDQLDLLRPEAFDLQDAGVLEVSRLASSARHFTVRDSRLMVEYISASWNSAVSPGGRKG